MKTINKVLIIILLIIFAGQNPLLAQQPYKLSKKYTYVFDADSLQGFEEDAARRSAISDNFLGEEFVGRMYVLKRSYINDKYNLWPKKSLSPAYDFNAASKVTVVPGCTNEDFEASTAGSVTAQNQIAGWTITRGDVDFPNNACNLTGCCPSNPVESELFNVPNGFIDPIIGSCYPIFSVFGTTAGDPNAEANNPQLGQPMLGDKIIRINSPGLLSQSNSIEKLSKTFAVTANNALFQFAFIFVTSTSHGCCDGGGFQIKLTNATANTVIACPSYSMTGPSSQCLSYTVNGIDFLTAQSCATAAINTATVFNKWRISSMDLSAYIGQNITIDVIVSDCNQGGHYGYAYFDAQCGPMVVYGNSVAYGAGTGSFNVPTCGAAGATLCASAGLGPYWWAGPSVPPNAATPSQSNICYVTAVSGQYTLYMNPPGSCAPIERVINATITPAPLLLAGVTQAVCGSTTAIVTVTPSGSAAVPSSLAWSPNPLSINGSTTQATYGIPVGPAPLVVTITAMDANGCYINAYANVNPAPPIPTFTPNFMTPSMSVTCTNYTVTLGASTTYTYGSLVYAWNGSSANYTGQVVDITLPGTYTVTAMDPVSMCYATPTMITVGINTVAPTATLQPIFQSITCANPAIQTVTTTATSPTNNIEHQFYFWNGLNVTGVYSNSAIIVPPPSGPTGTHTYVVVNLINGCTSTTHFSVASTGGFPTYTITSPIQSFSIGCAPKNIADIVIANAQSDPNAPEVLTYTVMPLGTTSYSTGSATSYTFNQPGIYQVVVKGQTSGCESISPFSIIQNIFPPHIEVAIPHHTLSCAIPSVQLTGSSNNPSKSYRWLYGTNGVEPGATFTVNKTPPANNLLIGEYVFEVKDLNNACISTQTVPIYQNIFPPIAKITGPSGANTEAVSCKIPSLTLNNSQSTYGSGGNFPTPQGIASIVWMGPSPQPTVYNSPSYLAIQPGTYSMTAMDLNNGCTSTTVFVVTDNRDYPVVQNPAPLPPNTMDCGEELARVEAAVSTTVGLNYEWFNAAGSIKQGNVGATGLPHPFAFVNDTGVYRIVVTNTVNGCITESTGRVVLGKLSMAFTSDKITGYAPLTVVFNNKTTSGSGIGGSQNTASIVSLWSFGNGNTQTVSALNYSAPVTQVYQQPGQYTVTLYSSKGKLDGKNTCIDSTFRVINVEIPSKLEIPNVFTPNEDGNNDLFFVRMANLSSIKFSVYDRWGNLVYELENSNNGNIEWNGKNQYGKDVAEGTYFYIVTATGKDGKAYDTKGTVNLFR
jgi:gliding motility-associated-like protein